MDGSSHGRRNITARYAAALRGESARKTRGATSRGAAPPLIPTVWPDSPMLRSRKFLFQKPAKPSKTRSATQESRASRTQGEEAKARNRTTGRAIIRTRKAVPRARPRAPARSQSLAAPRAAPARSQSLAAPVAPSGAAVASRHRVRARALLVRFPRVCASSFPWCSGGASPLLLLAVLRLARLVSVRVLRPRGPAGLRVLALRVRGFRRVAAGLARPRARLSLLRVPCVALAGWLACAGCLALRRRRPLARGVRGAARLRAVAVRGGGRSSPRRGPRSLGLRGGGVRGSGGGGFLLRAPCGGRFITIGSELRAPSLFFSDR